MIEGRNLKPIGQAGNSSYQPPHRSFLGGNRRKLISAEPRRSSESVATKAAIPLVLGVTGHRDLRPEEIPALERRVRELLGQLRSDYPHTPLRLISPLAEGADRLVARLALEADAELIVPLPLPRAEYERDFPATTGEFASLLERATAAFELPLAVQGTPESIHEDKKARDRQYEAVGVFIVRNCHLVIALWDGVDTNLPAGTAAIVGFKLKGLLRSHVPETSQLNPSQTGAVYHILTGRQKTSAASPPEAPAKWLLPADTDLDYFKSLYRSIDRFNADASRLATKRGLRKTAESASVLLGDPAPTDRRKNEQLRVYAAADVLALRFQRLAKWIMALIFVTAMLMVLSMEIYLEYQGSGIIAYLALFLFAASLAYAQRRLNYQTRYLDYRALAEGLRVQLFWDLVGLNESVASHYLSKQNGELQWVREALRAMALWPPNEPASLDVVRDRWVEAEAAYYQRCAHRDQRTLKVMRGVSTAFWAIGLLLAAGAAVLSYAVPAHRLPTPLVMVIVMMVAPGLAAVWVSFAEKMAFEEQARQYARMALLFQRARRAFAALPRSENREELLHLVRELGREALIENGDWVLLHRDRPIDLMRG